MTKKILLIEDEIFIRDLYARVLAKAGFEVITAADGAAGLKMAKENPDLILLDIMLPKVDGIEVLKQLKRDQKTKGIPVVLLTNLGQESIIQEAFKIGAQDYILKINISPQDLVARIKNFFYANSS